MKRRLSGEGSWSILPLLIILLLFYFPVVSALLPGITEDGRLSLKPLLGVFQSPYLLRILLFTFFQALVSTLFSLLLGLPGAWFFARYNFPGKKPLKSILTLPFILPPILLVLGFVLFFGNRGFLNQSLMIFFDQESPPLLILYSFKAIILAHVFYNFPICVRMVSARWENMPQSLVEASRNLGTPPLRRFRDLWLPHALPAILSSAALIFLYCFLSFAIVLVLGGGPEFTTIEVEIYRLSRFSLDFAGSGALAIIEMGVSLSMLLLFLWWENRWHYAPAEQRLKPQRLHSPLRRILFALYLLLLLILIIGPLASVVVRSMIVKTGWSGPSEFSLKAFAQIFQPNTVGQYSRTAFRSLTNSLLIALAAASISTILAALAAWLLYQRGKKSGMLKALLILPLGISSLIIGLGFLKIASEISTTSLFYVAAAHALISFPFAYRSLSNAFSGIPRSLQEASTTLGAGSFTTLIKILLPLLRKGLLTAFLFSFALSMGEINATLILSPTGTVTLPLTIYRLIGSYQFTGACALGSLMLVLCLGIFLVLDRLDSDFI